jgi:hypothetical protein
MDVSMAPIGGPGIDVETRTVDELMANDQAISPMLVKIDVEGFEPRVLAGMTRTLERHHPTVVFEALNRDALLESRSVLQPLGYSISRLDKINYLAEVT